jgi:hypothetical protein
LRERVQKEIAERIARMPTSSVSKSVSKSTPCSTVSYSKHLHWCVRLVGVY